MSPLRFPAGESFRSAIPGLGLFKGLWLTLRTFLRKPVTVMYPLEKELPPERARGVIALDTDACTVCMLCARECPSVLDRFDIDFALCMFCGICVEVCPFDALFWSPEYEYSGTSLADLLHDKGRLSQWLATVPEPPALEGSEP